MLTQSLTMRSVSPHPIVRPSNGRQKWPNGHIQTSPPTDAPDQWNDDTRDQNQHSEQGPCSLWRPKTPAYLFQIHSYSERMTPLQPPCIYSMPKNESPRVGPRLRCVWDTGPCIWDFQADLDALDSPVDCNDTEDITLSLASRAQIGTCQCCRVLLKLGSYLYPRLSLASCTGCRSDCMRKNAIALILMKLRHCGWWNSTERFPEIQQIIRDAFTEDDYEEELKAETLLWNDTPLIRMALEEEVRPSNDAFR